MFCTVALTNTSFRVNTFSFADKFSECMERKFMSSINLKYYFNI